MSFFKNFKIDHRVNKLAKYSDWLGSVSFDFEFGNNGSHSVLINTPPISKYTGGLYGLWLSKSRMNFVILPRLKKYFELMGYDVHF